METGTTEQISWKGDGSIGPRICIEFTDVGNTVRAAFAIIVGRPITTACTVRDQRHVLHTLLLFSNLKRANEVYG